MYTETESVINALLRRFARALADPASSHLRAARAIQATMSVRGSSLPDRREPRLHQLMSLSDPADPAVGVGPCGAPPFMVAGPLARRTFCLARGALVLLVASAMGSVLV